MKKIVLITITCIGIAALVFLDRWQIAHWRAEKALELRAITQLSQNRLENAIVSRFNAVESLASLFALHPETKPEEFAHFAALLLQSNPPIRALQYADSKTRVTYSYPPKNNEITISNPMLLLADPKRRSYVKKAIAQKSASIQGPFELRQGGSGVVVRSPIFISERFIGLAIGVYDVPILVKEAFAGIDLSQFIFRLADAEGRIFLGPDNIFQNFQERSVAIVDTKWTMTLSWTTASVNPPVFTRTLISLFGIGFLLSTILLIHFSWAQNRRLEQVVEERTNELFIANKTLINEIADHRQAEESLRENEKLLRKIAENFPNSYISIIEKNFTVGFTSGQEIKKQNLDSKQLIGLTLEQMFDDNADIVKQNYKRTFEGKECSFELFINNQHQLFRTVPLYAEDGSIPRILVVVENISERKKLEYSLQQAQKMEAIGTLAGGIAHDFNNILSPLVGYTEMLKEDLPIDHPFQANADTMLSSALRARDLVQQILTFSRKSKSEMKPIKLQAIIKEALKLLRPSIPKTIDIIQNVECGCGLVNADPSKIHQIVMNLATNAYHAMEEEGGKLTIALKQVHIEKDNEYTGILPGVYALLIVSDTGIGMGKDIIEKVFDPYFTTKKTGKGTGLGLSVVHGIVKDYVGDIRIYSELEKGTDIHVYIPVIESKAKKNVKNTGPISLGTERILLVDDEEAVARMEQKILSRLGYQVTIRMESIEALEVFKANPEKFDLLITDMIMPNMTGIQLTQEMRRIKANIPIIICTGFSDKLTYDKCQALGIQGYLMKPIVTNELAELIRNVLDTFEKN